MDAIGIEDIIQGIIGRVVDRFLLWPNRIVIPLSKAVDRRKLEAKVSFFR